MKKLRVLALMHSDLVPPDRLDGTSLKERQRWRTEFDVVSVLRSNGHLVHKLGVYDELAPIRRAIEEWQPDIAFNLLEEFHGEGLFDQHVVSYLELQQLPYTGCNPRGLTLSHDKALAKKILAFHRIPTPRFAVFPMNRKRRRPKQLRYPLIVKSLIEDASLGISQASLVDCDEKLYERVRFIHDNIGTAAIAEEYIDGRELYVGVLGTRRLHVFPTWEMLFTKVAGDAPKIATAKVKWDLAYQKKLGIKTGPAKLPDELQSRIARLSRRIYRALDLSGYARLDFRLDAEDRLYLLEANANPDIKKREDFAISAKAAGIPYDRLLDRILGVGMRSSLQLIQKRIG